ncbi:hypothetical protein BDV93DRAFT_588030 [Ceratobasidium sp. AG-I]|nr:hypothetical protein BDV93DRAFT_588030 [Ceratobasidium sp. AG-I]
MLNLPTASLLALLLALRAAAHTNLHGVYVGTGTPPSNDYNCVRPATSNNPITDYSSAAMICNTVTGVAANTCTANPGDTVTMIWHEHNMQETIAVGGAHNGPIQAYIAKVPSASQTNVTGLAWTKIYSGGLYTDGLWATDIANNNTQTDKAEKPSHATTRPATTPLPPQPVKTHRAQETHTTNPRELSELNAANTPNGAKRDQRHDTDNTK